MYFFNSKSDFFTVNLDLEKSTNSFIEGYELDLSDKNFKAEVLFMIKINNLDNEIATEFSDLLVDNFRIELLKLLQNDPYAAFEAALRKVNSFYVDYFADFQVDSKMATQDQPEDENKDEDKNSEDFKEDSDLEEDSSLKDSDQSYQTHEHESNLLPTIDVGVILLVDNKVYFTKKGNMDLYLIRSGQINQISDALTDNQEDEFFANVASGEFQSNDHFIISSDRILRYISFNDFLRFSRNIDTFKDSIVEALTDNQNHFIGLMSCYVNELKEGGSVENHEETNKNSLLSGFNLSKNSSRIFLIFITLLLIIFLVSGLVMTFNKNLKTQESLDVATEIQNIKNIIINAKSEVSNDRAFYTLNLASDKITELENLTNKSKILNDLKDEIQEIMLTLDNVQSIDEPLEIFSIDEFNPKEEIKGIFIADGNLLVASADNLYKNLASNQNQKVLNFQTKFNPRIATYSNDFESIIYLSLDNILYELNESGIKSLAVNNEFSDDVVDIFPYGKRLYFLDNAEKNVFKLQRVNNGYYSKSNYFDDSMEFLGSTSQIAIDGSMYAFTEKFQFNKYFKSELDSSFILQNTPYLNISNLTDVFTDFDHSFIYALDSKASKIYKYFKDSETNTLDYDKVFSFPSLDMIQSFLVDFNNEQIFINTNKKVYKFSTN